MKYFFVYFYLLCTVSGGALTNRALSEEIMLPWDSRILSASDQVLLRHFSGNCCLLNKDEILIFKKQLDLTEEQAAAYSKLQDLFHLIPHDKSPGMNDSRPLAIVENEEKKNEVKLAKVKSEISDQLSKMKVLFGSKESDAAEWRFEQDQIWGLAVMEVKKYRKEFLEPDNFSEVVFEKLQESAEYQDYKKQKTTQFTDLEKAKKFFEKHEKQIKDRAVYESCSESLMAEEFADQTSRQKLIVKEKEALQRLLVSQSE